VRLDWLALAVALLALSAEPSEAVRRYVNPRSADNLGTGVDSTSSGGTRAWRNVWFALTQASNWDTLVMQPGCWGEGGGNCADEGSSPPMTPSISGIGPRGATGAKPKVILSSTFTGAAQWNTSSITTVWNNHTYRVTSGAAYQTQADHIRAYGIGFEGGAILLSSAANHADGADSSTVEYCRTNHSMAMQGAKDSKFYRNVLSNTSWTGVGAVSLAPSGNNIRDCFLVRTSAVRACERDTIRGNQITVHQTRTGHLGTWQMRDQNDSCVVDSNRTTLRWLEPNWTAASAAVTLWRSRCFSFKDNHWDFRPDYSVAIFQLTGFLLRDSSFQHSFKRDTILMGTVGQTGVCQEMYAVFAATGSDSAGGGDGCAPHNHSVVFDSCLVRSQGDAFNFQSADNWTIKNSILVARGLGANRNQGVLGQKYRMRGLVFNSNTVITLSDPVFNTVAGVFGDSLRSLGEMRDCAGGITTNDPRNLLAHHNIFYKRKGADDDENLIKFDANLQGLWSFSNNLYFSNGGNSDFAVLMGNTPSPIGSGGLWFQNTGGRGDAGSQWSDPSFTYSWADNDSTDLANFTAAIPCGQAQIDLFESSLLHAGALAPAAGTTISDIEDEAPLIANDAIHWKWTAPDRGLEYEIRYSTSEITDANFSAATLLTGPPTPGSPGSTDRVSAMALASNTVYYLGIRFKNACGTWSLVGTGCGATLTTGPPQNFCP
jgi:hypothetical protein